MTADQVPGFDQIAAATATDRTVWRDGVPHLPLADWATARELGHRTVQRYISEGRISGAYQDGRKRWYIPTGAVIRLDVVPGAPADIVPAATPGVVPGVIGPLGALGTLTEAARVLGTTRAGVIALGEAGHLIVGPFGPGNPPRLRVYLPPPTR